MFETIGVIISLGTSHSCAIFGQRRVYAGWSSMSAPCCNTAHSAIDVVVATEGAALLVADDNTGMGNGGHGNAKDEIVA